MSNSNWSLYKNNSAKEEYLPPLKFSNGKTQRDVVDEILEAINQGHKIIFIKGVCGTGKSAIALNLAKELGKASVVVPVKALQRQYKKDYMSGKYLNKKNGDKLKINSITGRQNYECPYLKENEEEFETESENKETTLDIFNKKNSEDLKQERGPIEDYSCNNSWLPCKIKLKKSNIKQIRKYLKKNEEVKSSDFFSISDVRRMSIAPVCSYWSPIVPSNIKLNLDDAKKEEYQGLKDTKYTFYRRKKGCGYYDQYKAYLDSDVILFNSHKYILETLMNRKPATDVEIIDECDEFLDSFSNEKRINLKRLNLALGILFPENAEARENIDRIIEITSKMQKNDEIKEYAFKNKILPIKETKLFDILKIFLDTEFLDNCDVDDENYCLHVEKVAQTFLDLFDETYLSFYKSDRGLEAKIVTINLEKRFKELLEKNKIFVMMSGTIHSEKVLKEIFGIDDFKIIEAETKMPGKLNKQKTGLEINCKYSNFKAGKVTREQYLFALQKCLQQAEKPVLVHVNSFSDLPSEEEVEKYNLNIISRRKFKRLQRDAKTYIDRFKSRKMKVLYSTKCNRGADFPGDMCNSVILTKYPYPNMKAVFWKILRKTKPKHYNDFYFDKAKREFLQRIYRGLRSENDKLSLLSPDLRVFNYI